MWSERGKREEAIDRHFATDNFREVFEFGVFVGAKAKVLLDGAVEHHPGCSCK